MKGQVFGFFAMAAIMMLSVTQFSWGDDELFVQSFVEYEEFELAELEEDFSFSFSDELFGAGVNFDLPRNDFSKDFANGLGSSSSLIRINTSSLVDRWHVYRDKSLSLPRETFKDSSSERDSFGGFRYRW